MQFLRWFFIYHHFVQNLFESSGSMAPPTLQGFGIMAVSHAESTSSVQNPGWLFDIGDCTTQLYGDYNKPI